MPRSRRHRPIAEINVVPYIDVMLVLLVIFMITAPLLSQGVNVSLPEAKAKPIATTQPEPIIVSIDAAGNCYLNIAAKPEQVLGLEELTQQVGFALHDAQNKGQKRDVLVKGDKQTDYGKVVKVMAILQQAGAVSIGLMTQDPNQ